MNQQLEDYIQQARTAGMSEEQIKSELLRSGWAEDMVNQSLGAPAVGSTQASTATLSGPLSLLKQSLVIFKKRFGLWLGLTFLPLILGLVVVLSGGLLLDASLIVGIVFMIVFGLGLAVIFLASSGAMVKISDTDVDMNLVDAFKYGLGLAPALLLLSIVTSLVVIGGFVLLLVPGIIFSFYFLFSSYVLVHENLHGRQALVRSRELVRGYWWKVFWRFLSLGIIALVANFIFSIVFGLFLPTLGKIGIWSIIVGLLVSALPSLLVFFASIFYPYLVFKNLVAIKGPPQLTESVSKLNKYMIIGVVGMFLLVLLPVTLLSLGSARVKARDVQRYAEARVIESNLMAYQESHNAYPSSLQQLIPGYLQSLPVDPTTGQLYEYKTENSGKDYQLCVTYEKTSQKVCGSKDTSIPLVQ